MNLYQFEIIMKGEIKDENPISFKVAVICYVISIINCHENQKTTQVFRKGFY